VVKRIYDEIFNAGHLDLIDELVAPDFIEHEGVPGIEATGVEALRQFATMFRTGFPDIQIQAQDFVSENEKVVVRLTIKGTHQGEFMGLPPTGKKINISGIDIVRVVDGKLAEHWGSTDNLGMMEQLGALPEPV